MMFEHQARCVREIIQRKGVRFFVSRALDDAVFSARVALLIAQIRLLSPSAKVHELVDRVFQCKEIRPFQIRSELNEFLDTVQRLKPRTVVEIGTAQGGTLCLLCRVADKRAAIISIDLPGGSFGGGYADWQGVLYRAFSQTGQQMRLLRADSHSTATLANLREILGGREIDLLFIDADHTYEGVKQDFELYSPLVASGGIIGFHDIAPLAPSEDYGVHRFWDEVKHHYKSREIIARHDQRGFGIGLLQK
jgi:predicted O-methyltransferase YrrM